MIDDSTLSRIRIELHDYYEGDRGELDINDVADVCDALDKAEQQIAALQGRIEEADGFLRDQLAWCPCDEIHSDPPCDRCKRVAKWLTAPIAPEKEG